MPRLSVIVPSYNPPRAHLEALYRSLLAQTFTDFEVLLVDDASTERPYDLLEDPRFRVIARDRNSGPAVCRNAGAAAARAPGLFFTDTDCELAPDTLLHAARRLEHDAILMGDTVTRVRTPFGRAVALLGFPGGGILGFDKVWRVDGHGYTNSFSSCNLAFHKAVFEALGRFDESFPVAGGEDTVLARHAIERGHKIRYVPEQIVYHVQRDDLRSFIRWQIIRGRGNYHIHRRVPEVGGYLRLRVWTFRNSLLKAGPLYAPWVLALIVLSVYYQIRGYRMEKARAERDFETT